MASSHKVFRLKFRMYFSQSLRRYYAVAESLQGVVLRIEGWVESVNHAKKQRVMKCRIFVLFLAR
jgi:hypothetical protein